MELPVLSSQSQGRQAARSPRPGLRVQAPLARRLQRLLTGVGGKHVLLLGHMGEGCRKLLHSH